MNVLFRIDRLSIRGFRGVEDLDVELPAGIPTVLIGANNACKSTVLNALALCLRGGGFHQWAPEEYDFFQSADAGPSEEFSVTLRYRAAEDAALPAVQAMGNPTFVHGVRVLGKTESSGRFTHRHFLLDEEENHILLMPRTSLKGDAKQTFAGQQFGPFRRLCHSR
jgi:hypothetical protein